MGGSNQSLFIVGALVAGQGQIPGQGTAAVPLLVAGLVLGWAALPGWIELVLMWPNRVGGIAATCGEAFRPYAAVLGNLTGMSYWWGWIPTCGLTALLSASAISQWFLPGVSIPLLASAIVLVFSIVNILGVVWAGRVAGVIATASAGLAFLSAAVPMLAGTVDWHQAMSFHLDVPFPGLFGAITSSMAGLYLVGFAAPAFEAAACHVGETIDEARNVPRAMCASAGMATVYFLVLPVIWLGTIGRDGLAGDLAITLGPTFAPLAGAGAKSLAIWFMMFNMFHGTLAPLTGVARTLSQLSEDGLLPEIFARRTKTDCPWVAIAVTAGCAIGFLLIGDPIWLVAAANFTYLIGIALPSVAVWLLRRDQPDLARPYRAPKGTIVAGLVAAGVWGVSTILGFQQFGLPTVVLGLGMAYSGAALYAVRKWRDRVKAGQPGLGHSLHIKLTGAMLLVLVLDGVGYYMAVRSVAGSGAESAALVTSLEDIFVAVAALTIAIGLVLPGMIAHSAQEVAQAADRLARGTLEDFSRAMTALAAGDLDDAVARVDVVPVVATSRDELGEMARSFNALQQKVAKAAVGLAGAREGLGDARRALTNANANLERRVEERTAELRSAHERLLDTARQAGMAEVATGVLHNVGNVLNSVNISASVLYDQMRDAEAVDLGRIGDLLTDPQTPLGRLVASDERGRLIPAYLKQLSEDMKQERVAMAAELVALKTNVDHIKRVIDSQQSRARNVTVLSDFDPVAAMESALHINRGALDQHGIDVERRFEDVPTVLSDQHQIIEVLVNLIANAIASIVRHGGAQRTLVASVSALGSGHNRVRWQIADNGVGIQPEHLPRIFEFGFTTKDGGRGGLGLHMAALSAGLVAGSLLAHSDGVGCGATFTLEVPVNPAAPEALALRG